MIICICNNITTQDVQEAKDKKLTIKDLYKQKECCVQCGTCVQLIREELEDEG